MLLNGTGVGRGIAVGPVIRMPDPLPIPDEAERTTDAESEYLRAVAALGDVARDLTERARRAGGEAEGVILTQSMMTQDPALLDDVRSRIEAGSTAERAVFEAFSSVRHMLLALGGSPADRAVDIGDVGQRVVARLRGVQPPGVPETDHPFVLIAGDLAPADAAALDIGQVLGLITVGGGPTSHTAILARSKGIVAIVGVTDATDIAQGTTVLLDAGEGTVTVDPTADDVTAARQRLVARRVAVPVGPGTLADGTRIPLLANIGGPGEAAAALELGAEGIGLFRTELLFLGARTAPTVAEQQAEYARLFTICAGKRVVVRTLDAGSDKPLEFLPTGQEENPALGLRGIRATRVHESVLRDQLTAIAAADAETDADVWVMAPMVADADEAGYFVRLAREHGVRVAGVMAEVPSCALMAGQVLGIADFVSIGTNDLTQYTLAADRRLGSVASYADPWHPAVLRLVKMLGDAGVQSGRPVGVCGEAAADPMLAVVLVGLGATSLSMAPSAFDAVRTELRQHTLEHARALAVRALSASTPAEARAFVRE
ncbi:phosphoenolpyruvate--protein phosphotransferase [Mycetocola zhadangensis]|uniref:Phosphoenolpyruvate-protein phosphotransferase n=1 Tax=Mycetocola zhadangensis TaxID=1164595 RepID=A0A3L7IWP1_9MICO|nr:phosphoenolpyruvate--protein phosphotransferase [Mycetocola zhadangensis]RLQ82540.1 phosphoenolpyruvate--protein phosphotransferase [Mycetocola zhadangensis]GGF00433.1 phosphoenolpyruvate-protein phosphotransferase [Mycetocola zhadangensis]